MTDIQRHLKGIRKLINQTLAEDHLDQLPSALAQFLPKSYGVGSGILTNQTDESEPLPLFLYDVPLAGGIYTPATQRFPVKTTLCLLEVNHIHTLTSFREALARIVSAKKLVGQREQVKRTFQDQPIGQARRSIPKDRLPFAWLYCENLTEFDIDTLHTILNQYPFKFLPDQIDITERKIQFLNPLLEHETTAWYHMGWSYTPNLPQAEICYVCKEKYLRRHFFYSQLCMTCGDLNYHKRLQKVDLSGYRVLVTGGRVKIGYMTALRLLRAGAEIISTSRFPHDAAQRFAQETDFEVWQHRLHLYGLDLRQASQLESFITHLEATYTHLDGIINNAAQTIKRPPAYYAHLIPHELTALPAPLQKLLGDFDHLQVALESPQLTAGEDEHFPIGQLDEFGQQLDNRDFNSWVMRLEDIPPHELAEVHFVNAIVPAILVGQLKSMLTRSPHPARFVINVSAAEGRFSQYKNGFHPHTNMAKAALNMLTRTIGEDYAASGIYVTSVDPGWVSDQAPRTGNASREEANQRIPIDMLDAAARVCDPIFRGVKDREFIYGRLLKDYQIVDW